jgi:DNA-binding transcriptional MerR regulator
VTATAGRPLRIGELAELAGTTARTIRYYEEIGLLGCAGDRSHGKHRCYSEADVERLREIIRLRDLLGLSLEQLSKLVDAETARAAIRHQYAQSEDPATRRRLLREALGHIATQLELVRGRRHELEQLERELVDRRRWINRRLAELGG